MQQLYLSAEVGTMTKGPLSACTLYVHALVSLPAGGDSEHLFKTMQPFLTSVMADTTASPKGRKGCAEALGLGAFLAAAEITVSLPRNV